VHDPRTRPTIRTAVVLVAFALAIAGCRPAPPPGGPTLEPGGLVEVLDGVRLAASDEALTEALELEAESTEAPLDVTPLPPGVEAVGEAFRLAGDRDAYAVGDALIVIGVPVPAGTPTDDLALAVLEPADAVDDGDGENPEWVLLPGTYDADTATLAVGLGAIMDDGRTMLLVRSPDHDSVATASAEGVDRSFTIVIEDGFRVRCVGFSGGACTAADRSSTEATLDGVYAAWTEGLGYPEPRLIRRIEIDSWFPLQVRVGAYEYELRNFTRSECQNTNGRGRYLRSSKVAYTCYDASQTAPAHRTTRHEFFHALQYGYAAHLDNRSSISNAVAEGTARAAETSQVSLQRSPRSERRIDSRLFTTGGATGADYLAQDFWIYLGYRFGMGLDYLQPILAAGATTPEVDTVLRTHAGYPENLTLAEAYWAWAKNQAFEKTVDIGNGVLGDTCTLNADVVTPIDVTYEVDALPAPVTATLAPTSSMLVEIAFAAATGGGYDAALEVQTSRPADTLGKLYTDASGTNACANDPEGRLHTVSVEGATTRYLLVSNTSTSASADVTVNFGGFEIVSPAPGTTVDEGESIAFRADVSGITASPDDVIVQWSYERLDGVPFTFGTTDLGETLTASPFCDGTWTVTATTLAGGATRRASVDVVVDDLGDTTLVPGCEPTITITDPIGGGSYPAGEPIALRADTTVEGVATYPVQWRTGSAAGPVVATGEETTAVFAAGSVTLYATFGAASDAVSFDVAPGDPPTASIDSPADGAFYPWIAANGITVSFEGSGTAGAGGALSGADLRWESRQQGAATWTDHGTGATKDVFFSYFGADVNQAYDVRLIATDPATLLTGVDTISIVVQRPPD